MRNGAQSTSHSRGTPEEVGIGRQPLTCLTAVMEAAAPHEGCALLLGTPSPCGLLRVERIWPCRNVWEPAVERCRRFRLDPREQLLAQKWARGRGVHVLGAAHSHPHGEPVPSRTDRLLTMGPTLMMILAGGAGGWRLGCWWLDEAMPPDPVPMRRLGWRMAD